VLVERVVIKLVIVLIYRLLVIIHLINRKENV